MLTSVILLLVGLVLLTVASDQFVLGAARLAVRLRLSAVVVGAIVIGFGTSAPELVVSGLAAGQGKLELAVGNIVGSNVANLSLVLGAAGLLVPITVARSTLRREAPLSLLAVLVFGALVQGGLTRVEGVVLLVGLAASLTWIIAAGRDRADDLEREVEEFADRRHEHPLTVEIPRTVLGLVGTVAAAQVLITGATDVADRLGLAEGFVGLTIVAIGTSLPELATALQAARKGEDDLIVGNLLGSNLFNSFAVGGVAALVGPAAIADTTLTGLAVGLMVAIALAASAFLRTGRRLVRAESILLLAVYVSALPFLS